MLNNNKLFTFNFIIIGTLINLWALCTQVHVFLPIQRHTIQDNAKSIITNKQN
jgi:hypothetical protein